MSMRDTPDGILCVRTDRKPSKKGRGLSGLRRPRRIGRGYSGLILIFDKNKPGGVGNEKTSFVFNICLDDCYRVFDR